MKIELLVIHLEMIPTLVKWYQKEWSAYYGPEGPGNAAADLTSRCHTNRLPLGLVAIDQDQVLGTAALDLDVNTNFTPSIVGLLVAENFRGKGVGTALLSAAEDHARRLGHSKLYISTANLADFLLRSGWQKIDRVRFLNHQTGSVLVRKL